MTIKPKPMLSLLLGMAFAFGMNSCSDEREVSGLRLSDLDGDYSVSINLRGITTAEPKTYGSVSAETFESNLTTTHALIFSEEGKYLDIRPVAVTDVQAAGDATHDTKAKATFDLGTSLGSDGKTVKFVLVGNLNTANFNTEIEALRVAKSKASINELTLEDIKMLQITQASDAKDHFVMLGQPQGGGVASVTVKRNIPQEYSGVIDMERLSARIDVKIGGGPNNAGLSVTGVKLMKKQGHSYLYEKGGNPSGESLTSGEDASAMYTEAPFEKKIYTYENSVAEATYVEVSLALNGVALKPVIVPFTGKAIERNHIYTVSLDRDPADNPNIDPNLNQPRITFKVDVNDWNVDYRYIENYADDSAPVLVSVGKWDYTWLEPLGNVPFRKIDAENYMFHVDGESDAYLLLDVESESTQSVGEVIEGTAWMTLSDVTSYGGMLQQYRLTLEELDPNETTRIGKIEFRNKLHPQHKIIVTVSQGDKPVPEKPSHIKLPLEYVAEYNVNKDGTGFLSSHGAVANKEQHMAVNDAVNLPYTVPAFREYHLPSKEEWQGIIPSKIDLNIFSIQDVESIKVGSDEIKEYKSSYKRSQSSQDPNLWTIYGLRYEGHGNKLLSAWKYTRELNPEQSPETEGPDYLYTIKCIYLGPGYRWLLDDIAHEDFWTTHDSKSITRKFVAIGQLAARNLGSPEYEEVGVSGYYPSSTMSLKDKMCYLATFSSSLELKPDSYYYEHEFEYIYEDSEYPIRLFHGRPHVQIQEKPSNVKLPLEYVSEGDVNQARNGFVTDLNNERAGFFRYSQILNGFSDPALSGYHIPSKEEWLGIFPQNINSLSPSTVSETVKVGGDDLKTYTSIYGKQEGWPEIYAIRYQGHGNTLRSAWRYSRYPLRRFPGGGYIGFDYAPSEHWLVECVYLGPDSNITIEEVSSQAFWHVHREKIISRIFLLNGYTELEPQESEDIPFLDKDVLGAYASSTSAENQKAFFLRLTNDNTEVRSIRYGKDKPTGFEEYFYPVRLFSDR